MIGRRRESATGGPVWGGRALVLSVLVLLAACSHQVDAGKTQPDAASGRPKSAVEVERLDPASLADMSILAHGLDERFNASVRDCMSDRGFPQLSEAEAMRSHDAVAGARDMLKIDPLEMGPYTPEQATRYGMVGTTLAFSGNEPGSVVSRDASYEKALDECREKFPSAGVDVLALQRQLADLQNEARAQLLNATQSGIEKLVLRRLECVRDHGYPGLDLRSALSGDSFGELLRQAGVRTGKVKSDAPSEKSPGRGETVVYAPRRQTYEPSADEGKFARVYVTCGESVDFVKQLEAVQHGPRAKIIEDLAPRVSSVGDKLRTAMRAASAAAPSR